MKMAFPPEIYIIGAQKAGTTTLSYYLDQHPDITVADPKEPHFFTENYSKGLEWYKKQFKGPDLKNKFYVDASTSYTMIPFENRETNAYSKVPERVSLLKKSAKFIYILRNPVDRTYSGYWHSVRTGRENRPFKEIIKGANESYLSISDYYLQLTNWLEYFPISSFHFVLFEEMVRNPKKIINDCFEFLGVDHNVDIQMNEIKNKSYQNNIVGQKIKNIAANHPQLKNLENILPTKIISTIKKTINGSKPIPPMDKEDRIYLETYFAQKNKNLQEITEIPLSLWGK